MRVVAGTAKGRRLQAPGGLAVRPTGDRVREAIFDMLGSLNAVRDAAIVDLFAGTGALGIEALSRGAARATFVDDARASLDAIRVNLVTTGLYARATVVQADVLTWVSGAPRFHLAFADPPYAFDAWGALLGALDAGLAVLESDREVAVGERWEVLKVKHYGGTVVTLAQAMSSPEQKGGA